MRDHPTSEEKELVCGSCGAPIQPEQRYCPHCLAPASKAVPAEQAGQVQKQALVCASCGTPIPPGRHYCPQCLASASKAVPAEEFQREQQSAPGPSPAPSGPVRRQSPPRKETVRLYKELVEPPTAAATALPEAAVRIPDKRRAEIAVLAGRRCGNCTATMTPGGLFCPECGAPASLSHSFAEAILSLLRRRLALLQAGVAAGAARTGGIGTPHPTPVQAAPVMPAVVAPRLTAPPPVLVQPTQPYIEAEAGERLRRQAQITFYISIGAWLIALFTWGTCSWLSLGLAGYCLWRGNQLQKHDDPQVALNGKRAFQASAAMLIVGAIIFLLFILRTVSG